MNATARHCRPTGPSLAERVERIRHQHKRGMFAPYGEYRLVLEALDPFAYKLARAADREAAGIRHRGQR